ncbi:unnamed protein product [Phaeothamnion confervicola]
MALLRFLLGEVNSIAGEERTLTGLLDVLASAVPTWNEDGISDAEWLEEALIGIQSPDDLDEALADIEAVLRAPELTEAAPEGHGITHISSDSMFGLFLRRLLLNADQGLGRLSGLFDAVRAYVVPDVEAETRVEGGPGNDSAFAEARRHGKAVPGDAMDSSMDVDSDGEAFAATAVAKSKLYPRAAVPSAAQLQKRLQKRILELDCGLADGSRNDFDAIEREIQECLNLQPELPRAHFLRYLNCLRHRELAGAEDSLHRYFDYAMRRGGPNAAGDTAGGRHTVQYAALNLAAMHHRLGHWDLAADAFDEAIRVAQQNGDHVCVTYALGWLQDLMAAGGRGGGGGGGNGQAHEVLRRCIGQAHQLQLSDLAATATLAFAREGAVQRTAATSRPAATSLATSTGIPGTGSGGGSDRAGGAGASGGGTGASGGAGGSGGGTAPRTLYQRLRAAETGDISGLGDMAVGASAAGRPENMAAWQSEDTGSSVAMRRLLLEAAAADAAGYPQQASMAARAALLVYDDALSCEHAELATAILVNGVLRGAGGGGAGNATDVVAAGNGTTGGGGGCGDSCVDSCVYADALRLLCQRTSGGGSGSSGCSGSVFAHSTTLLLLEWCVSLGRLDAAGALCAALAADSPRSRGAAPHAEARLQQGALLCAHGRWAEATAAAAAAAELADTEGLAPTYARALLLLAEASLKGSPRDPVQALPHVLRCLAVAEAFDLDTLHAAAVTQLADVLLRFGCTRRAEALLAACVPHLEQHAPLATRGGAALLLAKCRLTRAALGEEDYKGGAAAVQDDGPAAPFEKRPRPRKTATSEGTAAVSAGAVGTAAAAGSAGAAAAVGSARAAAAGGGCRRQQRRWRLHLTRAVRSLNVAAAAFSQCQRLRDLQETWYLKARALHALGWQDEALRAAEAFVAVSRRLELERFATPVLPAMALDAAAVGQACDVLLSSGQP